MLIRWTTLRETVMDWGCPADLIGGIIVTLLYFCTNNIILLVLYRRYIQTAKIMKVPKLPMEEQRADGKMEEPLAKNTSDAGKSHHNVSVDEDDKGNEDDCLNGVKNDPLPYHICSRDKVSHLILLFLVH